jgi:tyrosine-protein phosphatase non-receptor type 13 protein
MIYLRFRYYPKKLEFIKTPTTTHSLYLQLRQDVLHDSLKPKRDKIFELAALALQAEFGDSKMPKMGAKVPYFKLQHFLPPRAFVDQDSARVESNLIEIHSHYSGQASILSERQFIELCQNEADYGAHYYRVYKFKPSSNSLNTSHLNDIFKIAILPDGLGICTQHGSIMHASNTVITQFHPWHMIRTLQFDRKRFLIATIENGIAADHVFYTDHYTKSGYLVKFAASQHRFMMKMRHWQYTLSRERPGVKDVAIERSSIEVEEDQKDIVFATMPKRTIPEKQTTGISESRSEEIPRKSTTTTITTTTQSTIQNPFEEIEESEVDENGPKRVLIKIILEKDPSTGLGLTLVDGAVEDIKGVYVKSVSNDGDAKKKGIEKGDCIQAINGISLVDKTRHDAVELVKQSGREVKLDIMRFPAISQILGHERQGSKEEFIGGGTNGLLTSSSATSNNGGFRKAALPSKNELLVGKRPSVSRTPPANRKVTPTSKNIRQRAASDFGAIGDALPVLKSEDLLAGFEKARRRTRSNSGSDESDGGNGEEHRGEYRLPVTSIYNFHASDDDDEDAGKPSNNHENGSTNYPLDDTTSWVSKSTMESAAQKSVQSYPQRQNLDWTNELSDIEDSSDNFGTDMQRMQISIHRLGTKTLGFQVASGGGFVSVKAVTSDPALSAGVKIDDRIIAVSLSLLKICLIIIFNYR